MLLSPTLPITSTSNAVINEILGMNLNMFMVAELECQSMKTTKFISMRCMAGGLQNHPHVTQWNSSRIVAHLMNIKWIGHYVSFKFTIHPRQIE